MKLRAENVTEESGQTDCQHFVSAGQCQVFLSGASLVESLPITGVPVKQVTSGGTNHIYASVPLNVGIERKESSRGVKITSVELQYKIATQAATAVAVKCYKIAAPADGAAASATEVAGSKDTADASCYDADEHSIIWTPTTAAFIAEDELWHLLLDLTAANGTVFDFYGAIVNYTRAL